VLSVVVRSRVGDPARALVSSRGRGAHRETGGRLLLVHSAIPQRTIAEYSGLHEPKAMQRFLNLTPWDSGRLRDLVRGYAMEHFADPRGVLIADPTGFAKKGRRSAGVQRQ
jgi:SRSO17 transposase